MPAGCDLGCHDDENQPARRMSAGCAAANDGGHGFHATALAPKAPARQSVLGRQIVALPVAAERPLVPGLAIGRPAMIRAAAKPMA